MDRLPKCLIAGLIVALVATVLWELRQRQDFVQGRGEVEAARETMAQLQDRLSAAEKGREQAELKLSNQINLNVRRILPGIHPGGDSFDDKFNAVADRDPMWGPYYRKLWRRMTLPKYEVLFPFLNLPAEKLPPLRDLLVERAICQKLAADHLRELGHKFGSPEVVTAMAQAKDDVEKRIENLVGQDAAEKLNEWEVAAYNFSGHWDGHVGQDAVTLSDAGFHLDKAQLVKLALIQNEVYNRELNPAAGSEDAANKTDPSTGLTQLDEQLFARESEVLPSSEIAVLRDWKLEEYRAKKALDRLRSSFRKSLENKDLPNQSN